MRRKTWLLPVFIGLAGIAGCASPESTTATSTAPTTSASAGTTATPTATKPPPPTGNGIAELKSLEILERAKQATKAAKSVRVRGQLTDQGETFGLDVLIQGSKAAGYLEFEGQRVEVILNGKTFYMKGDKQFWVAMGGQDGKAAAEAFAGKYLKMTTENKDFAGVAELASLTTIFDELPEPGDFAYAKKGDPTKIRGVPAIPVGDLTGAKIYVATEGEPYILRLDPDEGKDYLDFLDFGKTPDVNPPADDVIDLEELSKEAG